MTEPDNNELSTSKRALLKIRELKQQLADAQQGAGEPIAIISMACRFPRRASTPELFWQSLIDQTDEVSEIPADRWDLDAFYHVDPEFPGKMYARKGVFLDNLDLMDPEFFGISPREATWVDPQQRLLLEVGWEALERAGWQPEKIGEKTGIFVGWMHNDYQNEASDSFLNLNPYIATGAAGSFLPGRLAYYLGLQGPSLAVDTACSSSLVALHLACQSLQRGDCDQALVGGVNAIVSPTTNILTCKLKALSPSGHSRAFDAAADGYLRGEGCGVVTLRRLSEAERSGDPILGIIRGSAIGHNGTSSGLTAPNPQAQEKVIRQALDRAGIDAWQVSYLEAHGTGTELGDPIEVQAAAAALAQQRDADKPLLIGSVKTNIGHLEAAAGMAGLIKVLLAFEHQQIPAQLNFDEPNPHIPWDKIAVQVVTQATDWPNADGRQIASVSAFGMSGTNAHVVIEAPAKPSRQSLALNRPVGDTANEPKLMVLSAKSEVALQELAENIGRHLSSDSTAELDDVAYTTCIGRSHHDHRAAVVADTRRQAIESLKTLERLGKADALFVGNGRRLPKVAWQFTGQGSQYVGMVRGLYASHAVFREAIDSCDQRLQEWRKQSLTEVLFEHSSLLNHTSWTQPAIFAVQMGLAHLLESWGLRPAAVLGHSVGQYAAACVAGMMSWDDGLYLISERGRLIGELPAGGRMLAVFAPVAQVEKALLEFTAASLAAHNGTHVVVSGPAAAVAKIENRFHERKIRTQPLTTSHAFHSSLMEPVLEPFQAIADRIDFQPGQLPLVCNVSGVPLPADAVLDGDYWSNHIRQAVRFADGVDSLQQLGCDVVLELGPQSVLTRMAAANWKQPAASLVSCLQKNSDDRVSLLRAIGQLYVQGATPDFETIYAGKKLQRVVLPTYPFQRRRFWGPDKPRAFHAEYHTAHPLLGSKIALAGVTNETRYETFIEPDSPTWLPDHEVMGHVVMPGASYVEMALAVVGKAQVTDLVFEQPLRPTSRTALQTVVRRSEAGATTVEIFSAPAGDSQWTRSFTGKIAAAEAAATGSSSTGSSSTGSSSTGSSSTGSSSTGSSSTGSSPTGSSLSGSSANGSSAHGSSTERPAARALNRSECEASCPEVAAPADFYRKLQELGLNYGPQFQTIDSIRYSESAVFTHLSTNGDIRGFTLPPTLLDGALHSLAVGLLRDGDAHLYLPVGIGRVEVLQSIENEAWCYARLKQSAGELRTADITLFTAAGQVAAHVEEVRVQRISRTALRQLSGAGSERLLYELAWQPFRLPPATTKQTKWLVVSCEAEDASPARQLAEQLERQNHAVTRLTLHSDEPLRQAAEGEFYIRAENAEAWSQLFAKLSSNDPDGIDGIAWCCGTTDERLSDGHLPARTQADCTGLLHLLAALEEHGLRRLKCGLQLITTHAIATTESAHVDPQQTQFWGFGRVLGAERPELRCRVIDLDAKEKRTPETVDLLTDFLLTETRDNQLTLRGRQFSVPRMQQAAVPRKLDAKLPINPEGSYLITGGLGKLGQQAAKWLAEKGGRQIILVSRRPADDQAQAVIDAIEAEGCEVIVQSASMSSASDIAALCGQFGNDFKPLAGVIHAAGVLDDGLIADQNWERFENVLAPKVIGATLLHEFTKSIPLDFFILYSSAASVLGSPGQSNYATANGYLDGLAWQRRSLGLPALSINWGPWTEGMADDERVIKRLALQGITPLAVSEAHDAMEKMLAADLIQTTALDVDWQRMQRGLGGESPAILAELTHAKQKTLTGDSEFVGQLKQLRGAAQRALLVETIQRSLQEILSTPDLPETDRPLIEMGLDSLMAVEFGTELQILLGDQGGISPTMLFDHPTIDAISEHVLELIVNASDEVTEPSAEPTGPAVEPGRAVREDVAIVGMSCRFPGADNVDAFWDNLLNQVDSVSAIPADRWDVERFYRAEREPGKMITREGGFLEDIGDFDAAFFSISDQEACWIDPQHRLLLENSYRALEDAGISPHPLVDTNVGVFMGIMGQDYAFLPSLDDVEIIEGFQGAGLSHSAGVGRISYVFGFEGPSIAIDTASSSSLVALFHAVRSLQEGGCNMALAGGVNAILAPVNSLLMSKAGLLSPDGRCKSFSADADGFGRGEGCGVVVLKRLSDAERDGDRVMAVVRGGAVVHNGFSGGITSPSGKSQARVIDDALKDAGIAPAQVQYLEAHGTGTEFGDAMELGAAASVYGKGRKPDEPLLVGSVKANISHLEAAGGVSGLIKTVLSLHHGVIPPQLHFDRPSRHIPWERLPVQIVSEPTAWPQSDVRIAGVTALGLVGTNAHVVLSSSESESAVTTPTAGEVESLPARPVQLLVFSARSKSALEALAASYHRYLANHEDVDLADFCATLASGRRHHEYRVAVTASSREELQERLANFTVPSQLSSTIAASSSAQANGHACAPECHTVPTTDRSGMVMNLTRAVPKVAWVFTGKSSDRLSQASELYRTEPVFRDLIANFDERLAEHGATTGQALPKLHDYFTTASDVKVRSELPLFALQAGLAKLWESWGIEPDTVLGVGIGQYTAACVAGTLCFEDALTLIAERATVVRQLEAVRHDSGEAIGSARRPAALLPELPSELPAELPAELTKALDRFEAFADRLNYYPPSLPLICSLSATMVPVHRSLGGSYWREHCLNRPQEVASWQVLTETACDYFLQLGPADEKSRFPGPASLTSLSTGQTATHSMLHALGQLYVGGASPDFQGVDSRERSHRLSLPTYPFQKKRYWITEISDHVEQNAATIKS